MHTLTEAKFINERGVLRKIRLICFLEHPCRLSDFQILKADCQRIPCCIMARATFMKPAMFAPLTKLMWLASKRP